MKGSTKIWQGIFICKISWNEKEKDIKLEITEGWNRALTRKGNYLSKIAVLYEKHPLK